MKECLNIYEKASGQIINFQKSSISFSRNTQDSVKEETCVYLNVKLLIMDVTWGYHHSLVLTIFSFVKDKAWRRIQRWFKKALSKVGKEILLKLVVKAVPTYVMSISCYLSLCVMRWKE